MEYSLSYAYRSFLSTKGTRAILKQVTLSLPQPLTLREIAKRSRLNPNAIVYAFKQLDKSGVITTKKKGNSYQVTLNKHHPFYNSILSIVHNTTGLGYALHKEFTKYETIQYILLTHSYIFHNNKDNEQQKPIVLFIGTPNILDLTQTLENLEKITDKNIPFTVFSSKEIRTRFLTKDPFIVDIFTHPTVFIKGTFQDLVKDIWTTEGGL